MKKRTKKYLVLGLTCLFATTLFAACMESEANKVEQDNSYHWTYTPSMGDVCDEDMTIDGVMDEERWSGLKKLVHKVDDVEMEITTTFTDLGVYIGASVYDPNLVWVGRMNFNKNSCFWLSVKAEDTTYEVATDVFNIYVDGKNGWNMNGLRFQSVGKTDKPYEENPTRLTTETFLTWEALNIELGENGEYPDCIRINPHYRRTDEAGTASWLTPMFYFDDRNRHMTSGRFDETGYINADSEDSVLGNAGNGYAKSDGWDLSKLDEGKVTADVGHSQAIFFKDIYSSHYWYTVTVEMSDKVLLEGGGVNGAGVIDANNHIVNNMFYFDGMGVLNRKEQVQYTFLTNYSNGAYGWKHNAYTVQPAYKTENNTLTYTIVKDGSYFYYIVNGKFITSTNIAYLSGASCPGFFALDCAATFTDYQAEDLTGKEGRIDEILAQYDTYRVKRDTTISGGDLEMTSSATSVGGNITVKILPNTAYMMTGFKINGEDCYTQIANGMVDGVYTFENVTETLEVEPIFTQIPSEYRVRVTGKLTQKNTAAPVLQASMELKGTQNVLHYFTQSSNSGNYVFIVPKAGTYEIGGKSFTFDGRYSLAAKASGFIPLEDTITVASETITKNYEMSKPDYDIDSYGMVYYDGEYTYVGDDTGLSRRGYVYTDVNKTDSTILYSVKVKTEKSPESWTNLPVLGIAITDKSLISDDCYQAIEIGFNQLGLSSWCTTSTYASGMYRRLDAARGDRWNNSTTNTNVGLTGSNLERTLTVALYGDVLYIFVDGQYINGISITDSEYFSTAFGKNGKYTIGLNAYNFNSATNTVSFKIEKALYGSAASEEIVSSGLLNALLERKGMKQKSATVYEVETAGSGVHTYQYTNVNQTDTSLVYSAKIELTSVPEYFGNEPIIGITLTDKTVLTTNATSYKGVMIGLGYQGLLSVCVTDKETGMYRRLDVPRADRWDFQNTINEKIAFTANNLTRTLTVAVQNNMLSIYVDNTFVAQFLLTDTEYFNTNFATNTKYTAGISVYNFDKGANSATFTVLTEKYGTAADAEIESNYPLASAKMRNVIVDSNGSYAMPTGWRNFGYAYSGTYAKKAVYTVAITSKKLVQNNGYEPLAGLTISNGSKYATNERMPTVVNGTSDEETRAVVGDYYGVQVGFRSPIGSGKDGLYGMLAGETRISYDKNNAHASRNFEVGYSGSYFTSDTEKSTHTVTVVLNNDTFYFFADDKFVKSYSVTDATFKVTGATGTTYGFNAGDSFMFGVACVNLTDTATVTAKVQAELYGDAAMSEITRYLNIANA